MAAIDELVLLDELTLTYRRGRAKFRLAEPLRLTWVYRPPGAAVPAWRRRLTVPAGSDTNGPSIPRVAQSLLPVIDDGLIAAAVHDYLASTSSSGIGRAEADALARAIKLSGNVPAWRAWLVWAAVRLFGRITWHGAAVSLPQTYPRPRPVALADRGKP